VSVPLPVSNHNQGNTHRARVDVSQTQLAAAELKVLTEVRHRKNMLALNTAVGIRLLP